MNDFKPMLAKEYDPDKLVFPCYASPKLDGIRASVINGQLLSRSLKPIPNRHTSSILSDPIFNNFDGELIANSPTSSNAMQEATSFFMSQNKVQAFTYWVFDLIDPAVGFKDRYAALYERMKVAGAHVMRSRMVDHVQIKMLAQTVITDHEHLAVFEAQQVGAGYEGVILRKMDGIYKFGRSTVNEGLLLKVKRFTDGEAIIIGFEEEMHNDNKATLDNLGRTKRSSHKENKFGTGTLGALVVKDCKTDITFNIGSGISAGVGDHIWANREAHEGRIVKYKSFEVGVKDKPRHPVFLGFRDARDMS